MGRDILEDRFSSLASNAETADSFIDDSNVDHGDIARSVAEDCLEIAESDLSSLERRLAAQAVTLDMIFNRLATTAASALNFGGGMEAVERPLKLALKAQQQSANTMKVLAEIKQPKNVTFAKQANVAHQQVVHNGAAQLSTLYAPAHVGNNLTHQKRANELEQIGVVDNATLDSRIAKEAVRIDAKKDT